MIKIRKSSSFLVAFMLLLGVFPLSSYADTSVPAVQQNEAVKANVVAKEGEETVDLLKEDTKNSEVLTSIPTLTEVTVLAKGLEYTKVTYTDLKTQETWTGYVLNESLADPSQSGTQDTSKQSSVETAQVEKDSSSVTNPTVKKDTQTKTVQPLVAKASLDSGLQALRGIALKSPTNIYSEQATNSMVLKSYAQGTILKYNAPIIAWYECTVIINGEPTPGYINANDVETTDDSDYTVKGISLKSPTNIYSAPSTDSVILKSYTQGSTLQYNKQTIEWYDCTVIINGTATQGYISASDVETVVENQQTLKGIGLKIPTNIYSKASTSAKAIKSYAQGTILKYKTLASDWYECTVYINGKEATGYISASDVEKITDSPQSLKGIGKVYQTNIYSMASKGSKVRKSYSQGTILKYETFTSDWYECAVYIKGKKITSYISASDVDKIVDPQQPMRGLAQKSSTKIYSKAYTGSKVLKSYEKNTILSYKTFTSGWYECTVIVNGNPTTGYIKKGDVSIQKTTVYDLSLDDAIAEQMNANPKADGAGKIKATEDQVAYYINPNNFAQSSSEYYQFLILSSYAGTSANELNNSILAGKGVLDGEGQAFITAAKTYNINELYLISHSILETGNGASQLATGVKINGKTVYNVYGIGAYDDNATQAGAQYAYDHGWTTIEKAIIEGAQFVSVNYINAGQDTLYKMRWNPAGMIEKGYANHQYATDVGWAVKQTSTLCSLYNQLTIYTLLFDAPVYHF
jgi:mannosyl-glycoprotein endo-beta-N-acetylglucosaminidase